MKHYQPEDDVFVRKAEAFAHAADRGITLVLALEQLFTTAGHVTDPPKRRSGPAARRARPANKGTKSRGPTTTRSGTARPKAGRC
jgi:hypothetical protein